jgi:uncharacterized protein (DUF488 family)
MKDERTIWTVGHSTRSFDDFIALVKSFGIKRIADIRSFPGSRKFPQFNKESLEISLPQNGIEYFHLKNLGGRRKTRKDSKNTAWRLDAFRGYADYMETDDFINGIEELEQIAVKERTAYMCSESLWWRCHRSLVSDYLKLKGWKVMHIMEVSKSTEHSYTKPARIVDGNLNYSSEE